MNRGMWGCLAHCWVSCVAAVWTESKSHHRIHLQVGIHFPTVKVDPVMIDWTLSNWWAPSFLNNQQLSQG